MKQESIILNIYPINRNSLKLISFDELKFPFDIDFGSIKVVDNSNRRLISDLINLKGYSKKLKFLNEIKENHLALIINRDNIKYVKILYRISNKLSMFFKPNKTIELKKEKNLIINTKNTSLIFEKKGYSIEKIKINGNEYGPLHLVASGGDLFFQKELLDSKSEILSDSNILKIIKITGKVKVLGNKCKREGILPIQIIHYFWSSDGKNLFSKIEFEFKYDEATDFSGKRVSYLDPLIWYRLENYNKKVYANSLFVNDMDDSKIITLNSPYISYLEETDSFFAMCPYLALPNDGIHIEKGKNFFGASWHSLSKKKIPYWAQIDKKEYTGRAQGLYPAHSLRSYWKIGLFFGDKPKAIEKIAKIFSYPPKIRNIIHSSSNDVSNAYIARWKDNKKMAFNAITDDAKVNDYLYRVNGFLPNWVQTAISTRTVFNINYHRFCYIGNKIFYLEKNPYLSTILSTLLCFFGIGNPFRRKFKNENISLLLHTNHHPRIFNASSETIIEEIEESEGIWIKKWKYKMPLSHILSFASPYGIPTKVGSKEKVAFSASKSLEWIREWPIPNAPLDFFLPTKLFWGVCVGEFFDKKNNSEIKNEFIKRYNNGSDYMILSGHVPDQLSKVFPQYLTNLFDFFENHIDVWFTGSDDIIKYYKSRENVNIGRIKKQGENFLFEIKNNLPPYFQTEITIIQHINKKINNIQCTMDNKNYFNLEFINIEKNIIQYNIPSNTKKIKIS